MLRFKKSISCCLVSFLICVFVYGEEGVAFEGKSEIAQEILDLKNNDEDLKKRTNEIKTENVLCFLNRFDLEKFMENQEALSFYEKKNLRLFLIRISKLKHLLLTQKKAPKLFGLVSDLCKKLNISMPVIFLDEKSRSYNAMSFYSGEFSAIVLDESLVNILSQDELSAIIAHELAHIKFKHINKIKKIRKSTLLAGYSVGSFWGLALVNMFFNSRANTKNISKICFSLGAATGVINLAIYFKLLPWMWHKNEKQADSIAAKVTDAKSLICALKKIEQAFAEEDEYQYLIEYAKSNLEDGVVKKVLLKNIRSIANWRKKIKSVKNETHPSYEERFDNLEKEL
jgi:Zn-dependent protease with chaperone function